MTREAQNDSVMKKEHRTKAIADLTITYLRSYYPDWRLAKVLANKKILDTRYEFFAELMPNLIQEGDIDGKRTIAHEIKHGIYFDTIAQCVQYVEDLFALFRAAERPDFFIKDIVSYDAGPIASKIKNFKKERKNIENLYCVPKIDGFSDEGKQICEKGIGELLNLTSDIVEFYKNYEFFNIQYKHGLTIPMRPFGNVFTDEQVSKDEKGEMPPYLVVYDNFNLEAGQKRGTFSIKNGLVMPGLTENVTPYLSVLSEENNFLRFVFPPDIPNFSFFTLEDHARKVRTCIQTFIVNYSQKVLADNGKIKERSFQLPADYKTNSFYKVSFEI